MGEDHSRPIQYLARASLVDAQWATTALMRSSEGYVLASQPIRSMLSQTPALAFRNPTNVETEVNF